MATIAIGDIHGYFPALDDLLGQIGDEVQDSDTVVFLGDYIDRGPNSRECVEAILEFRRERQAEVVCVCGNHGDWFLRTLRDYRRHSWLLGMEALDTILGYSPQAAQTLRDAASAAGLELITSPPALPYDLFFNHVPGRHVRVFETLVPYQRTADCVCVHGGLDPHVAPVQDQ